MSLFESLSKRVTDTAMAAARKSGNLVEVTKLSLNINTEEEKAEKAYIEIGKAVYESFSAKQDVSEDLKPFCEEIESYENNIKQLKEKINELRNLKVCPKCDAELELDDLFCFKCGEKQEIPEPVVNLSKDKNCTACNALNNPDSNFCSKCGTKLE